ncbi:MAG: fibronectin type III domain-containing protein, partial [Vicinamibacterales bacterium]
HRITLDTGVRDATWGLSPSARALAFDGSTLYMGGSFQAMSGAGCGTSFPLTARRGAAAMNLATCQLTNWNPNLHGPASTDGVYSMALAGQTMVMGGNFTTASHGAIGLIGVNLTDGAATVAPLPGLTSVSAVATDGARAFAYGMSGATSVLAALNPGGAPTAVQASFDPFASPQMTHFGGRIYAGHERDEVTLQPTAFPQQFSRAFRMATGVLLVSGDNTTAYYPLAQAAAPNPPQNLTAHASGHIVTLGWSPPAPATGGDHPAAGAAASYVVRAGSGTGLSNLADFDTGSLTTGLTASAPSGRYYVRVHARNAIGLSSPSNEVQFTLGPPACTSPPAAPGPLAATVAGLSVTFTWGPAANATSYVLEAGAAAGGRGLAVVNVGAAPTFRASAPAGVYYVRVRGSNACGVGPASNEVIVTLGTPVVLPGPPANLTVTRSGSAVTLAWSPPTSGGSAASYVLAAGTAPGLSDIVVVPLTSTTVSANAPPGSYFVRVHAVNAAGQGPPSNEVRVDVP